jgi:hypothetical protein
LNLKRQALRGEWGPGKQTPESESRSRTEIPRDSPIQVPDFAGKWGPNPRFPVGRRERASGPRGRWAGPGDFGLWAKVRFPQLSRGPGFSAKLTCSELHVTQ